ncbi:MAG: hypothetical protein PHV37_06050 [Candidatus Gastranaerophilales bacterium]|nr:hypothetical protein [Candidatus Gastranaerophilales bacterium]
MKKLIIFLALIMGAQGAFAVDYSSMCMSEPYPVSGAFPHFMSNASGMNFLLTQVAESQVQKSLKKQTNSKFKVQIEPFGAKNFIDGKFKSMTLNSKSISTDGVYISDFNAKTLCDYNQVVIKNKKEMYFPTNLILNYSAVMTSDDFKKTVLSSSYINMLNKLNISIGNTVLFKVYDPTAKISNNKINMSFKVITPMLFTSSASTFTLNSSLGVKDGQIVFSDFDLGSSNSKLNMEKILPLVNKLNPLSYDMNVTNDAKGTVKVSNVKIDNDRIVMDGVFIIPKNYVINSK